MLLLLIRHTESACETRGRLWVDGKLFAETIEPPVQGNQTHKKGAVPRGWYRVRVTESPRFGRLMPLLYMVPGFEGIRIHAGLRVENTQGCICVGERWREEQLTEKLLKAQTDNEEIYICITDTEHVDSELQGHKRSEHDSRGSANDGKEQAE